MPYILIESKEAATFMQVQDANVCTTATSSFLPFMPTHTLAHVDSFIRELSINRSENSMS